MIDFMKIKFVKNYVAIIIAATFASISVSGCGSTPKDEFANIQDDQLYTDAKNNTKEGNYEKAIKELEKLEARSAGTPISMQAQLDLAYAYYKSDDHAQALATVERFIKNHPNSPGIDYAYYLKGLINFNGELGLFSNISNIDLSERDQQASKDAYQAFSQVVTQFPVSPYAADARLRMSYISNSLAAYEVHVASYYYRRGAYLATVNRAQQAVQEFPTAPSTEKALYLMIKSYEKMNLPQLRKDAEQVLNKNFPNSHFNQSLEDDSLKNNKHWWQFW
jgi:outer membrane protein assembly factor BamD